MRQFPATPTAMWKSLWDNRKLIKTLTRREVIGRYRGSTLGILWSFFHPLLMLAVYTFVFSVVFSARWPGGGNSRAEFALTLFAGLIIFNLVAECLGRAPSLIIANTNYVKKVVFPLEVLTLVSLFSALFHTAISFVVWLAFYCFVFGLPHLTVLLFPIVLIPLILVVMGLTWIIAALGVYLRDINQIMSIAISVLMFGTPIFYPAVAIPEKYRPIIFANPLTFIVEQTRDLLIWGKPLNLDSFFIYFVLSVFVAVSGFAWFQKTRKGFADVL